MKFIEFDMKAMAETNRKISRLLVLLVSQSNGYSYIYTYVYCKITVHTNLRIW